MRSDEHASGFVAGIVAVGVVAAVVGIVANGIVACVVGRFERSCTLGAVCARAIFKERVGTRENFCGNNDVDGDIF